MKKKDFLDRMHPLIKNGIAHRGYHNENDIENGLRAFKNAVDNNIAFELDVHLSKDGNLIVCHDSTLKRVTDKDGVIEDLTLDEIKNNYTLKDGEKIPTLREVLDLVNERVPIVLEIKSYKGNGKALCNKIKEELKSIKDSKSIMIIAFDPRDIYRMRKERFLTSLLLSNTRRDIEPFRVVANSVDIDQAMIDYDWTRKYYKRAFVNVWTINSLEKLENVKGKCDTVTFENIDFKAVEKALNN